jgi:hypothetical protein
VRTPAATAKPSQRVSGLATWYCHTTSPCTAGYRPGQLIAAAGSELRAAGFGRGDVVRVTSGSRSVAVRIVDVCACPGARVIDLSAAAFFRLAPLSRGVIAVQVSAPVLPQTDEETR